MTRTSRTVLACAALLGLSVLILVVQSVGPSVSRGGESDHMTRPRVPATGAFPPPEAQVQPPSTPSSERSTAERTLRVVLRRSPRLQETVQEGTLFGRPGESNPGNAATAYPIRAGLVSLGSGQAQGFHPIAVRVGNRPLAVRSYDSQARIVYVEPYNGLLIEVRKNADGVPASQIDVMDCSRPGQLSRPGLYRPDLSIRDSVGSPILIAQDEIRSRQRTFFLRTTGSAWTPLFVRDTSVSSCHDLVLVPGGSLDVAVELPEDPVGMSLQVRTGEKTFLRIAPVPSRRFEIPGLPEGELLLLIGSEGVDVAGARAIARATVKANTVTRVTLGAGVGPPEPSGSLTGTLQLPLGYGTSTWGSREKSVSLRVVREVNTDGNSVGREKVKTIPIERMQSDPSQERRWHWSISPLDPGGYRLEVRPLGYQSTFWIDPGADLDLDVQVPSFADARIHFVDEATHEDVDAKVMSVSAIDAGHVGVSRVPVLWTSLPAPEKGLAVRAVPGSLIIWVDDPYLGSFSREIVLDAGRQEQTLSVARAAWIELTVEVAGKRSTAPREWWEHITLSRGGTPAPILGTLFPASGGGASGELSFVRFCIQGTAPVDILFPPYPGHGNVMPLRVDGLSEATPGTCTSAVLRL